MLAGIGYEVGQPELIERSLRQMQLAGQEWPYLLYLSGRLHLRRGETTLAREQFARALARRPGDLTLLQLLLDLDLASRDWPNLERWINQILVYRPNHEDANYALAVMLRERNRLDLAEAQLRELARARRTPRVLAELAEVQRRRGAFDDALATANEAVQRMPRYAHAREVRGRVLVDLARLPEAGVDLKEARVLDPDSFSVAAALVDWYLRSGENEAAKSLAREALASTSPRTPDQENALRSLVGR